MTQEVLIAEFGYWQISGSLVPSVPVTWKRLTLIPSAAPQAGMTN